MGANPSTMARYKAMGGEQSHHRKKKEMFDSKHIKPPAPEYFSKEQKKQWQYFSEMFFRLNVLTETDAVALEMLVVQYTKWRVLEEKANNLESNKYATYNRLSSDAYKNLLKMLSKFGMTPTDRARIGIEKSKKNDIDNYRNRKKEIV